jgi:PD-(D/E)XK nuclease superfamily
MIYRISQHLNCPRRYRYRYLDGWKEKDTRSAMLFGRAFEQALSAYFRRDDPGAVLFREWAAHKDSQLDYSNGTTWTACCSRASSCSSASPRTIGSASASSGRTCRSSSHDLS